MGMELSNNENKIEVDTIDYAMIWNLCEYGISARQIKVLYENNIGYSQLANMSLVEFSDLHGGNRGTQYNKIREVLIEKDCSSSENISVFYLCSADLSEKIAQECFTAGIKYYQIPFLSVSYLYTKYGFRESSASKIIDAYNRTKLDKNMLYNASKVNEIVEQLYSETFMRDELKKEILNIICDYGKPIKLFILKNKLDKHICESNVINQSITELAAEKRVEYTPEGIHIVIPTIMDFLSTIQNDKWLDILTKRLEGKKLEEIGDEYGITRERVRQLSLKALDSKPYLKEDNYKDAFEKYSFEKEIFMDVFKVPEHTYNYLNIVYKKGDCKIENILKSNEFDMDIRTRIETILYKDYIAIGTERIKPTTRNVLGYLLRTHCKEAKTTTELFKLYNDFIDEYGLQNRSSLQIGERYLENRISGDTIWGLNKRVRYYDMNEYDLKKLLEELDLGQYEAVQLSTLKLFRDNPKLMEEFDIRDEYELHCILKRIINENEFGKIRFGRTPIIEFGTVDRNMLVLDLILEMAPVQINELAKRYEEEYGVKAETVKANFLKDFDEYYHNGFYDIESEALANDEFIKIKSELTNDIYMISDIKEIFYKHLGKKKSTLINSYNLKRLGYRINSNYIYSDKYGSAEQYFRDLLNSSDIIDLDNLDSRMVNLQAFHSVLTQLRNSYELIEFSTRKYINYRRLEAIGITKEELAGYRTSVLSFIKDGEYFTIKYLENKSFVDELDKLGFESLFYSSILRVDDRFRYRRVSNSFLFRRTAQEVSLKGFIQHLIYKFRSIDIYEFVQYIETKYDIRVSVWKVRELINGTEMYYDSIMEKVYIDYDEYFEEV